MNPREVDELRARLTGMPLERVRRIEETDAGDPVEQVFESAAYIDEENDREFDRGGW